MCVYVSESSVIECIQDCEYVKCVFTLLSASYAGTRGYGSRYYSYLVLRDNEIHVLLSRTAKRIHLKVIIPQECATEECGANFYTVFVYTCVGPFRTVCTIRLNETTCE